MFSCSASYTCGTSSNVTYSVNVIPAPVVAVTSASPALFCSGLTVTFQTSGASTYTLQPGNLTGTPPFYTTPSVTTQYTLTGTNASGCVSKNLSTSNITVKETPTVTVNSGAVCIGSSFQMTPSGANTYVYSSNFSAVTPSTAGTHTYSVVGTSTNGCTSNTAISTVTVNALPTISVVPSKATICAKNSATLTANGATSYTWSSITGTNANNAAITVSPGITSNYSVTGTDANGCVNGTAFTLTVSACVGLIENSTGIAMQIFPNPARTELTVDIESAAKYSIFDLTGKEVLSGALTEGTNKMDVSQLQAGAYLLRVSEGARSEVKRLIIE